MIPVSWLVGGVGAVVLAGAIGVQEIRLSNARGDVARAEGQRDVAKQALATEFADHNTTRLALEAQRHAAVVAVEASDANLKTLREDKVACEDARAALRGSADSCRRVLDTCRNAEAVAVRWEELDK